MVGLMEDSSGEYSGQGMGQPRGVAVAQPQGPNAVNILAMELQRTNARVGQLEQIVSRIVQVLQGPPQQAPQGQGPVPAQAGGQMPGPGPQGAPGPMARM